MRILRRRTIPKCDSSSNVISKSSNPDFKVWGGKKIISNFQNLLMINATCAHDDISKAPVYPTTSMQLVILGLKTFITIWFKIMFPLVRKSSWTWNFGVMSLMFHKISVVLVHFSKNVLESNTHHWRNCLCGMYQRMTWKKSDMFYLDKYIAQIFF